MEIEFDADDYVDILSLESLVRLLEIKTALEVLDIHDFHLHLVVIFNKEVSEAIFRKAYEKYATKYAYHPFQEYIENLLDKEHQPSKAEYENAIEYLNKDFYRNLMKSNEKQKEYVSTSIFKICKNI